jgi:3-dehydroquinate synthase class II
MPPKEAFEGAIAKMQSRQAAIMATVKNCLETVVAFEPFEHGFIKDLAEPKPSKMVPEDVNSDEKH